MAIFPNVPRVPGVPPLARDPFANLPGLIFLTRDVLAFFAGVTGPRWGLYLGGVSAVNAQSVVSFEYKQDWKVADYPLEKGAFESYDKVKTPFDVKLRFASGGSEIDRLALLDSIAALADSLALLDAVTPEKVYTNVNVNHYDYRRTSTNGVGLLVVDAWCVQVRVATASDPFSSTAQPGGASPVSGGTVQTTTPTAEQIAALGGRFF